MTTQKVFCDIGYTVVGKLHENKLSVEFKCYKVVCFNPEVYERKGEACPANNPTSDLAEAQVYLSGWIKWDGCSNWTFDEQEECALHFCDRQGLLDVGELMARCWDIAKESIPSEAMGDGGMRSVGAVTP